MKIAVIGAGAIGCVTGAFLWDNGYDVTLVGRPEQVRAINAGGLAVMGFHGGRCFTVPAAATLDFSPDLAFVAVKSQDVPEACRQLVPHAAATVTVTMQNGVRSDELAAKTLGAERLVSSVVMFGATYVRPGVVEYNFPGGLVIGRVQRDSGGSYMLDDVFEVLSRAFHVSVSPDIHGTHWTKLLLNLNNALAGALGMSLQEVFSEPGFCRAGIMVMKEALLAMEKAGISIMPLPDLPAEKLKGLIEAPVEVGSEIYGNIMKHLSDRPLPGSILQSIRRGRPSEVDYINGEVAALGDPAPLNAKLTELVKEVERSGRFFGRDELLEILLDVR